MVFGMASAPVADDLKATDDLTNREESEELSGNDTSGS